ncbi:MAG: AAA family ATPase [Alphaproteobacteria bacterium]|nr:AAA family ATPase [Alphaproteobacteria bacterium]
MKVIYLTGAPAAGKSTTLEKLQEAQPSIFRFEYGAELTKFIQKRGALVANQKELRALSSQVVLPEDIEALDNILLEQVDILRGKRPVIIDSHPVTKETYGYRLTTFAQDKIQRLRPDEIWVFYTPPSVMLQRISRAPEGRPMVTEEEARMHTYTQVSVAAFYGVLTGAPVYLFDTNKNQTLIVRKLLERMAK